MAAVIRPKWTKHEREDPGNGTTVLAGVFLVSCSIETRSAVICDERRPGLQGTALEQLLKARNLSERHRFRFPFKEARLIGTL